MVNTMLDTLPKLPLNSMRLVTFTFSYVSPRRLSYMLLLKPVILAPGKTANIYTDSQYAFGVARDLEHDGSDEVSLPPMGRR